MVNVGKKQKEHKKLRTMQQIVRSMKYKKSGKQLCMISTRIFLLLEFYVKSHLVYVNGKCQKTFFSHSVEKREIHCHANFFRQINLLRVKFFSKKLISRNFCRKMVAVVFHNFHTVFRSNFRFFFLPLRFYVT